MAKIYQIPIIKISDDQYKITKNSHLEFLIKGTYGFHDKITSGIQLSSAFELVPKGSFIEIISKLLDDDESILFSKTEISKIRIWIDSIVVLVVEWDTSNLRDKSLKKYLKIAQNFIEEINKYLPLEKIKEENDY